jgi:hypothetical protein
MTEIVPLVYRGKAIIGMNAFTSVGKLVALFLAFFCLEDAKSGDWRLLMLLNGIIALLGPLCISIFFYESPRFLIASAKYDEGFAILNLMGQANKGYLYTNLSQQEMETLISWRESHFRDEDRASIKSLFTEGMRGVTTRLWLAWFAI